MTNYEYEDYRNHQRPSLGSWPFWTVPELFVFGYLFRLILFLFVIPSLFGIQLTVMGLFVNFLVVDFIIYLALKKVYERE